MTNSRREKKWFPARNCRPTILHEGDDEEAGDKSMKNRKAIETQKWKLCCYYLIKSWWAISGKKEKLKRAFH